VIYFNYPNLPAFLDSGLLSMADRTGWPFLDFYCLAASTKTVSSCLIGSSSIAYFFIYRSLFSRYIYVVDDDHGRHEACPDSIMSLRLEV
jgi:hypothetical protein